MTNPLKISIAKDFSETPGARYTWDWTYSWELFYNNHLKSKFESLNEWEILEIDLDDIYSPPSSFLSESFGPLYRNHWGEVVWGKIKFISNDDPLLVDLIKFYAKDYD